MAAGLGFKDFTTGEVLTAADVDGYLMQGIWVFASAAARDAAVTSPQEGNFAFLKDTNTTTYYTGSAWTNLDTTGMVNPMTTTGDTIYSSSGSTPARLGIGTTGQVLTVAGGVPSWATPASGSFVGCSVYKTDQTLSNAVDTAITWQSEDFDTDGFHSTATNTSRFTIPSGKDGKYLITGQLSFDVNATGSRTVSLFKNGSQINLLAQVPAAPGSKFTGVVFSIIVALVATDYVEIYGGQNSGGNLNVDGDSPYGAFCQLQFLGA